MARKSVERFTKSLQARPRQLRLGLAPSNSCGTPQTAFIPSSQSENKFHVTNVTFYLLFSVLRSSGELLFSLMGKWMKMVSRTMEMISH